MKMGKRLRAKVFWTGSAVIIGGLLVFCHVRGSITLNEFLQAVIASCTFALLILAYQAADGAQRASFGLQYVGVVDAQLKSIEEFIEKATEFLGMSDERRIGRVFAKENKNPLARAEETLSESSIDQSRAALDAIHEFRRATDANDLASAREYLRKVEDLLPKVRAKRDKLKRWAAFAYGADED